MVGFRMSIAKIHLRVAVTIALLSVVPQLSAQYPYGPGGQHHTPRPDGLMDPDGFHADLHQPFIDPGVFDYDFQVFSPADITSFGDAPAPNVGFWFTYDRVVFDVGRPSGEIPEGGSFNSSPWEGDEYWGNRWDGGYMTEDDHGWMFSAIRLNGSEFIGQEVIIGNLGESRFLALETWGIEANKVYRIWLDDGAMLEPFLGVRYLWWREILMDGALDQVLMTGLDSTLEQRTKNQMVGFQLGTRLYKKKGHWTLSAEGRAVAAQNYQFVQMIRQDPLSATTVLINQTELDFDEFSPFGEVRLEAMYNLTRDFSLRVGVQLMYFPTGLLRPSADGLIAFQNQLGRLPAIQGLNDQDLWVGGASFGFVWNR